MNTQPLLEEKIQNLRESDRGFWSRSRLITVIMASLVVTLLAVTITFLQQSALRGEIHAVGVTQERLGVKLNEVDVTQDEIVIDRAKQTDYGYRLAAAVCLIMLVDNDRDFRLSDTCTTPDVLQYYPPQVCDYFQAPSVCASKFVPSPLAEAPRFDDQ